MWAASSALVGESCGKPVQREEGQEVPCRALGTAQERLCLGSSCRQPNAGSLPSSRGLQSRQASLSPGSVPEATGPRQDALVPGLMEGASS